MEEKASLLVQLNQYLESISSFVWGPPLLILLVGTGLFLSIRLLFLQFRALPLALKQTFISHGKHKHDGDISHFAALMTALSATIGTGNIAGVATAVVMGGPGAIFWMWITALVGMATKYAECLLAVKYRVVNYKNEMSGGPMYYIEQGLGKNFKFLAILFAVLAVVASFGIGCSVQANTVADVIHQKFNISKSAVGCVLMVFTALVVLGGIKSIARASIIIVPIMAVIYLLGGLYIIIIHSNLLPQAFSLIIRDAFTADAATGAFWGTVVRYGVARGLFSNEAGLGSAPIAAAAAQTDHPVRQALVAMTGTFLDTIVVCSITGLVLVIGYIAAGSAFPVDEAGKTISGASLTALYFENLLPHHGSLLVAFGTVFFAYSTIIGWCYYGEKCMGYLIGDQFVLIYRFIYVWMVLVGAVVGLDLVWNLADIFNALMAIPNLIALLLLSNVVVRETNDFFKRRKAGELY